MPQSVHLSGCVATSGQNCTCEARRYWYILALTGAIVLIQLVGSIFSGSLALLADTAHAALDGAGAGISVYVAHKVRTHPAPADLRIRCMRLSCLLLFVALAWIAYEAFERFGHPRHVIGWNVMAIAGVGALLNIAQHRLVPHDHSVTSRAQRLHVIGDFSTSIMVIVGGFLMWTWDEPLIDPILSLMVVVVVGSFNGRMLFSRNPQPCGHSH